MIISPSRFENCSVNLPDLSRSVLLRLENCRSTWSAMEFCNEQRSNIRKRSYNSTQRPSKTCGSNTACSGSGEMPTKSCVPVGTFIGTRTVRMPTVLRFFSEGAQSFLSHYPMLRKRKQSRPLVRGQMMKRCSLTLESGLGQHEWLHTPFKSTHMETCKSTCFFSGRPWCSYEPPAVSQLLRFESIFRVSVQPQTEQRKETRFNAKQQLRSGNSSSRRFAGRWRCG